MPPPAARREILRSCIGTPATRPERRLRLPVAGGTRSRLHRQSMEQTDQPAPCDADEAEAAQRFPAAGPDTTGPTARWRVPSRTLSRVIVTCCSSVRTCASLSGRHAIQSSASQVLPRAGERLPGLGNPGVYPQVAIIRRRSASPAPATAEARSYPASLESPPDRTKQSIAAGRIRHGCFAQIADRRSQAEADGVRRLHRVSAASPSKAP